MRGVGVDSSRFHLHLIDIDIIYDIDVDINIDTYKPSQVSKKGDPRGCVRAHVQVT